MEHARTGPSTGSSPLVARTTLPSCTCCPSLALVHLPHSYRALHTFLPGMSLREHCNRSCPGRAGRLFDARGGLILRSSRFASSAVILYCSAFSCLILAGAVPV